jgi:hypothetical protein
MLEILRTARRSAADLRKVFLALYGLLLFVPFSLLAIAAGRTALHGDFGAELSKTFLRPVLAGAGFFRGAFAEGRFGLVVAVLFGFWLAWILVGSFFGLAITRMAAVEITGQRRADVAEARRFARSHGVWGFLTPAGLVLGALLLIALGAGLLFVGRASDLLLIIAAPISFGLVVTGIALLLGYLAGGILAWPAISTEWSDAFDAVTRVYGYSFTHAYRMLVYRAGALVVMAGAVLTRGFRAVLVLGVFYVVLRFGLGAERTRALVETVLLEPPQGLPLPQTLAAWTVLACVAIFLTLTVARLLVYRLILHQYLLLRLRVDKVAFDNIDGYRPDDSDFDPTAQGFQLVEVEEELGAQ